MLNTSGFLGGKREDVEDCRTGPKGEGKEQCNKNIQEWTEGGR
jgi:hypothetical protein